MRLLKALVLILAITGTVALLLASRATARPLTAISAINPAMNYAYVRIAGRVVEYPSISTDNGALSFQVQDAGGIIRVTAYRAVLEKLLARKTIPMPGSQATVEGTLRVREGDPALTLNDAAALQLETAPARLIPLAALDAMQPGDRASVIGQVRRVRDAGNLRIVSLRSGSATGDLLIPLGLSAVIGQPPLPAVGDWISVTGSVAEYRGKREMLVTNGQDVAASPAQELDLRPFSALTRSLLGQWVAIRGDVSKLRPLKQGMLIDLTDGAGGSTTVAMFDIWYSVPFSRTLKAGDSLMAQGVLVDYNGRLEMQPELSVDLIQNQ